MSLFTHQKKRISREQSKNTLLVKGQSVNHYPGTAWWIILSDSGYYSYTQQGTRESPLLRTNGRIPGKNSP